MNYNVSIWYAGYLIRNPPQGSQPTGWEPQRYSFLLTATSFSLLGCFHLPYVALFGRAHGSSTSNTLGSPGNPGFTFPASCSGFAMASCRDFPATQLTSGALLNRGERLHSPFTHVSILTWNLGSCGRLCQVWLPMWIERGALNHICRKISFLVALLLTMQKNQNYVVLESPPPRKLIWHF